MDSKFDWVPTVSVGRINLGEPVTKHVESGFLRYREGPLDEKGKGSFAHGEDEDPAVYMDDNNEVADTIICFSGLNYLGQNFVGKSIIRAIEILGQKPDLSGDKILDDDDEYTVTFDSLGLILWVREEDDLVVSATITEAYEDE